MSISGFFGLGLQWTPENGLITSAMKIRRKPIQKNYQDLIDVMYEEVAVKRSKKQ